MLALRDGGGGVEGRRGEGSRPQVLGERAAAARAGFVAERRLVEAATDAAPELLDRDI